MGSLVKFELKKIIKRKSTYITMIICFVILAGRFITTINEYSSLDQTNKIIKGTKAVAIEKENFSVLPNYLSNENIKQTIDEFAQNYNSQDENKFNEYINKRQNYLFWLTQNYFGDNSKSKLESLLNLSGENYTDFYKTRINTINDKLNDKTSNCNQAEKAFWLKKATNSSGPYNYGFHRGWSSICNEFSIFILFMLGICIAIAPVYNCEYQSGIDSILLASKYGKNKLNLAKIIASFIFGIGSLIIALAICFGIIFAFFGTDGWNLPIQLMGSTIAYPFNFLQLALIMVALLFVVTLALISLTLFLSAKFKNPTSVLAIDFLVIFLPQFLHMSKISIISKLISLTPYQIFHPMYDNFISYAIGNIIFDYFTFAFLIYFLVLLIATPLALKAFKNHQVG